MRIRGRRGDEAITDIVSQVTVSSAQPVHLLDYNVGMHANVSNMSVIGQSYLNPQSTAGYSPSEGIAFAEIHWLTALAAKPPMLFLTKHH